jgi:predicted NBD/HSP70 family sugar kinase
VQANGAAGRETVVGRVLRPTTKALPGDSRAHNRSLILSTLFHAGPCSRADLARATGLTRVTVSDLVAELIEDSLVQDVGKRSEQRVGKPATIVELRADACEVIAVDLSDTMSTRAALVDLAGNITSRLDTPMAGATGEEALKHLDATVAEMKARSRKPLLGIGVASPGVISPAGVVREAPNYRWNDLDLAGRLTGRFYLPAYVANDANTAALAEFTFGAGSGSGAGSGFMVITFGKGLGAGIVIDGALLRGHSFAAGELGHVTAVDGGEVCACGRRGCLETILSAAALRRVRDEASGGAGAGSGSRAGAQGLEEALYAVGRQGAVVLAPVVGALNLSEIVLAGPTDLLAGPLANGLAEGIRERVMAFTGLDLTVRAATLGQDMLLAGALALVLAGELGVS